MADILRGFPKAVHDRIVLIETSIDTSLQAVSRPFKSRIHRRGVAAPSHRATGIRHIRAICEVRGKLIDEDCGIGIVWIEERSACVVAEAVFDSF